MDDTVLLGNGREINQIPAALWREQLSTRARRMEADLQSLSEEHHKVRNFAVGELPSAGGPLSPARISGNLRLPVARVNAILDELERGMTYLFRDGEGAVTWAYPVTVDKTPHRAIFSTGEEAYSA